MYTRDILSFACVGFALSLAACGDNDNDVNHIVDVADEPAGTNCAEGGVRLDSGWDEDGSGGLDETEVESTRYVCNGADGSSSGGTQVVKEFQPDGVLLSTQGEAVTVLEASITTEGPGQLVVIGSADAFCLANDDCPALDVPAAAGWMWISDENQAPFTGRDFDYFYMRASTSVPVTRTGTFDLTAAGEHTVYMRGDRDQSVDGWFNFYRRSLTLIFLPE